MHDRPLFVAHLDPPDLSAGGDWFYRSYSPSKALSELAGLRVALLNNLSPHRDQVLMAADVVVVHNVCDMDLLPLMARRKARGKVTVFEISDDITDVQPWSAVYSFYANDENRRLFHRLAHSADGLQFTVDQLQKEFGFLNPKSAVFENQLLVAPPSRRPRDSFVLGWAGSHGHLRDVASVAKELSAWILAHEDAELAVMGSSQIFDLFDSIPSSRKHYRNPGTLHDYNAFLSTIDIGLAPLCDNAFNRSRSDVKFLEYAAHGVVPVVQDLEPYRSSTIDGETALLFRNPEQLLERLDCLYANPQLRASVASKAHQYVCSHRIQKDHAPKRVQFYRSLSTGDSLNPDADAIWQKLPSFEAVASDGLLLHLQTTAFERLLHDGLVLSQQEHRPTDALRLFRQASLLHPESHLPDLFSARLSAEPLSVLMSAVEKNPQSIRAHLDLSTQLYRRGDVAKAVNLLLSAAQLFPSYELPYQKTIPILQALGANDEASAMLERVEQLLRPIERPLPQ